MLFRAVILRNEGGKRVPEVLHGGIGQRIDLDPRRKRRHNRRAKAVHEALHHQDAKVHDGLLHARHRGKAEQRPEDLPIPPHVLSADPEVAALCEIIHHDADAGKILRNDRRCRRADHAPAEMENEQQVERHIREGGNRKKDERHNGISHRAQQVCEDVIQERCEYARKDHLKILPEQRPDLGRDAHEADDAIQKRICKKVQKDSHRKDADERNEEGLPHNIVRFLPELDGKENAAPHAEATEDRGEEDHDRVGRAHRGKRIFTKIAPHHQRIHDVVKLLEQVSDHQRERKQKEFFQDRPLREVDCLSYFKPRPLHVACPLFPGLFPAAQRADSSQ